MDTDQPVRPKFDPFSIRPSLDDAKRQMEEEAAAQRAAAAARPAFNPLPSAEELARTPVRGSDSGAAIPQRAARTPIEYLDPDTGMPFVDDTPLIERWEDVNIDAFSAFVEETKVLTPNTRKTYRSAFRRLMRDFPLPALKDPTALQAYRSSMALGTRNTFDASWPCIVRFMAGYNVKMPMETPAKRRIRFTHPLVSDFLTIGGVMNYSAVPTTTWRQLVAAPVQDMMLLQACRRICEFQTGLAYSLPPKEEHLDTPIAAASAKFDPVPEWRIKWILDSERDATTGIVEQDSAAFFLKLVGIGIGGVELREFARLFCRTRNTVKRHRFAEKTMGGLFALIKPLKLSELRERLLDLGDDADEGVLPLW